MRQITFLMENWYLVVALLAVACVIGMCIGRFLNMPTETARQSETMAVMGGYAGGKGIGRRHWKIETAPRL